jgi:hypothetical protein
LFGRMGFQVPNTELRIVRMRVILHDKRARIGAAVGNVRLGRLPARIWTDAIFETPPETSPLAVT